MRAALALVAVLALPARAIAGDAAAPPGARDDEPDAPPEIDPDPRAVEEAREANLVPVSVREGFAIGVAVGPAIQIGYSVPGASGTGGSFNLRFGTVASPRWVWLLEIGTTTYESKATGEINSSAVFSVGGQLYVNEAFWLRGGAGLAAFTRREDGMREEEAKGGFGVMGAGGFDLLRRGGLALSIEGASHLARYREGTIFGASLQLGLSWY